MIICQPKILKSCLHCSKRQLLVRLLHLTLLREYFHSRRSQFKCKKSGGEILGSWGNCKLQSLRTFKMSVQDNSFQKTAKHLFSFYLHPNISKITRTSLQIWVSVRDNSIQTCDWREVKNLCRASLQSFYQCQWGTSLWLASDRESFEGYSEHEWGRGWIHYYNDVQLHILKTFIFVWQHS